jgi:hypothetical protein
VRRERCANYRAVGGIIGQPSIVGQSHRIPSILNDFAAQIRAEVQRQAVAALTAGLAPAGVERALRSTLARNTAPARAAEPNGHKRDPKVIEALQAKLLAYIAAHPGQRIEQINKGMGTTTKAIFLPIKKLIAAKKIKATGERRATAYAKR